MKKKKPLPPLLYADSETNPDQLYFGEVFVPDPFISFEHKGKRYAVVSALEISRVKRTSRFDKVLSLSEIKAGAKERFNLTQAGAGHCIAHLAAELKITGFTIPVDFPAGVALQLKELGLTIELAKGLIYPQRAYKSDNEAKAVKTANAAVTAGFKAAEELLRGASIERGYLMVDGRRLTSERVKEEIFIACLKKGALATNTIVAGGLQGCDPHERGSGPLKAHELIVIDIFPRNQETGYHGDMTRTFLRGEASQEQKQLVQAVCQAQRKALKCLRAGVALSEPFRIANATLEEAGFRTEVVDGTPTGFFHGLGHGLGLAVHEPPRMGASTEGVLEAGHVVTVEPGLYYPKIGGCRIEDVVRITEEGYEMLSRYHYMWHLQG